MKRGQVAKGSAWALVTGAASGIGSCYARRLAALGYHLVVVDHRTEELHTVARTIEAECAVKAEAIVLDLAHLKAAETLYNEVTEAGIEIDVLINNAGIFSFCDLLQTDEERIERILLLHDMTATKLCRRYAARMIERGVQGHILNMSSYSLWMPFPGLAVYSASKAYLKAFSVAFAKEVREHGIRVTAICPAGVATNLYGLSPKLQKLGLRLGALISADRCARRGLSALWRGVRCSVPDWWNRLWIPLLVSLPMWVLRPLRNYTMKFQK